MGRSVPFSSSKNTSSPAKGTLGTIGGTTMLLTTVSREGGLIPPKLITPNPPSLRKNTIGV
jgi:hypothetical protein